ERPHRLGRGLPVATRTDRYEILADERVTHDGEITEAAHEHGREVERVPLAVRLEAVRQLRRLVRELLEPLHARHRRRRLAPPALELAAADARIGDAPEGGIDLHECSARHVSRSATRTTSRSPDHVSSTAHTLLSTRPSDRACLRITSSVTSVFTPDAFFGQATQRPPSAS